MGFFKNLKQARQTAKNWSPEMLEEQLADFSPEQRAAYDKMMEEVDANAAEARAGYEEAVELEAETRVLFGPAGEVAHGRSLASATPADELGEIYAEDGFGAMMKANMKGSLKAETGRMPFGRGKQEKDPVLRAEIAAAERAARDAAREPYLAPDTPSIAFSRLATRGKTQLEEVATWLAESGLAGQPQKVYGLYRVPDRISQTLSWISEGPRVVEWEIVHEAGAGGDGAAADAPESVSFGSKEHWVARRAGELSLLDEDLALVYLMGAGIGPERTIGVTRYLEFVSPKHRSEEKRPMTTNVEGVTVFHAAGLGGDMVDRMEADAPMVVPQEPEGVHIEILNWDAVRRVVQPRPESPPRIPAQFDYLPSSPQELLQAYLEVVGVRAADCYGAAATVHDRRTIQSPRMSIGPKQPCADDKDRQRYHCCEQVVVTYRDSPDYVTGRERWQRYQKDVLQANLERGVRHREEMPANELGDESIVVTPGLIKAELLWDRVRNFGTYVPPPMIRYCWPPVD